MGKHHKQDDREGKWRRILRWTLRWLARLAVMLGLRVLVKLLLGES